MARFLDRENQHRQRDDRRQQREELRERGRGLREQMREQRDELRRRGEELRQALREQAKQLRERRQAPRMGSRGQPEESRAAILKAAAVEFAEQGIAGARTDAIARQAGVNKALLYYYFKDKETLYGAVLENAFEGLKVTVFRVLDSNLPPREKILAYVGAYFDFIASNPIYPRLTQREMMRAREGRSPHFEKLAKSYFKPIFERLRDLIGQGISAGEFRPVDPVHFVPSMVAIIVFYFSSAPMMQRIVGFNPLAPERIAERRAAVLDFISAALFRHRDDSGRQSPSSGRHSINPDQGARS